MASVASLMEQFLTSLFRLTLLQYLSAVVVLLFLLHYLQWRKRQAAGYPPGPLGFPLVGSLPYMTRRPYKTFTDMAARYGDVFSLQFGSQNVVVLNSKEMLEEAFHARGKHFNGRPKMTMGQLSMHRDASIPFAAYWPRRSRVNRKLGQAALNKLTLDTDLLSSVVDQEVQKLAEKMRPWVGQPVDITQYVKAMVSNVMFSLVYGSTLEPTYRDEFKELVKLAPDFTRNVFIASLLDMAPSLKVFFKSRLAKLEHSLNKLARFNEKLFEMEKDKDLGQSLFKQLMELLQTATPTTAWFDLEPAMIPVILTDLSGAGVETTSTLVEWEVYLLATHQDVQASLQEELDAQTEKIAPLHLSNRRRLPKLQATVLEILRSKPAVPLALPHLTLCDTNLAEYSIPKHTVVMANLWAVNHDPRHFKDPFEFKPERFHRDDEVITSKESCPFGVGMRKCLGFALANQIAFLALGSLLKRFSFKLSDQTQFRNHGDDEEFDLVMHPKEFKIILYNR